MTNIDNMPEGDAAERMLADLRRAVCKAEGLPPEFAERLRGSSYQEIQEDAASVADAMRGLSPRSTSAPADAAPADTGGIAPSAPARVLDGGVMREPDHSSIEGLREWARTDPEAFNLALEAGEVDLRAAMARSRGGR